MSQPISIKLISDKLPKSMLYSRWGGYTRIAISQIKKIGRIYKNWIESEEDAYQFFISLIEYLGVPHPLEREIPLIKNLFGKSIDFENSQSDGDIGLTFNPKLMYELESTACAPIEIDLSAGTVRGLDYLIYQYESPETVEEDFSLPKGTQLSTIDFDTSRVEFEFDELDYFDCFLDEHYYEYVFKNNKGEILAIVE